MAVVADRDVQRGAVVGDGDLDATGSAVPDRVGQRLGDDEIRGGLQRCGQPTVEAQIQLDRVFLPGALYWGLLIP